MAGSQASRILAGFVLAASLTSMSSARWIQGDAMPSVTTWAGSDVRRGVAVPAAGAGYLDCCDCFVTFAPSGFCSSFATASAGGQTSVAQSQSSAQPPTSQLGTSTSQSAATAQGPTNTTPPSASPTSSASSAEGSSSSSTSGGSSQSQAATSSASAASQTASPASSNSNSQSTATASSIASTASQSAQTSVTSTSSQATSSSSTSATSSGSSSSSAMSSGASATSTVSTSSSSSPSSTGSSISSAFSPSSSSSPSAAASASVSRSGTASSTAPPSSTASSQVSTSAATPSIPASPSPTITGAAASSTVVSIPTTITTTFQTIIVSGSSTITTNLIATLTSTVITMSVPPGATPTWSVTQIVETTDGDTITWDDVPITPSVWPSFGTMAPPSFTSSCSWGVSPWCLAAPQQQNVQVCKCPQCLVPDNDLYCNGDRPSDGNPTDCPEFWDCLFTVPPSATTPSAWPGFGSENPPSGTASNTASYLWNTTVKGVTAKNGKSTTSIDWDAELFTKTKTLGDGRLVLFPIYYWRCQGPLCKFIKDGGLGGIIGGLQCLASLGKKCPGKPKTDWNLPPVPGPPPKPDPQFQSLTWAITIDPKNPNSTPGSTPGQSPSPSSTDSECISAYVTTCSLSNTVSISGSATAILTTFSCTPSSTCSGQGTTISATTTTSNCATTTFSSCTTFETVFENGTETSTSNVTSCGAPITGCPQSNTASTTITTESGAACSALPANFSSIYSSIDYWLSQFPFNLGNDTTAVPPTTSETSPTGTPISGKTWSEGSTSFICGGVGDASTSWCTGPTRTVLPVTPLPSSMTWTGGATSDIVTMACAGVGNNQGSWCTGLTTTLPDGTPTSLTSITHSVISGSKSWGATIVYTCDAVVNAQGSSCTGPFGWQPATTEFDLPTSSSLSISIPTLTAAPPTSTEGSLSNFRDQCQAWAPARSPWPSPTASVANHVTNCLTGGLFPVNDNDDLPAKDFTFFTTDDTKVWQFCQSLEARNVTLKDGTSDSDSPVSNGECSWYDGSGGELSYRGFDYSIGLVYDKDACKNANKEFVNGINIIDWAGGKEGAGAKKCHNTIMDNIINECTFPMTDLRHCNSDGKCFDAIGGRFWQDCMRFTVYAARNGLRAPETNLTPAEAQRLGPTDAHGPLVLVDPTGSSSRNSSSFATNNTS